MQSECQTALDLLTHLRERRLSAVELLEATIERSERIAPRFNPFALTLYDRARAKARTADEALGRGTGGLLCGLPITVKDSQWLAGVRCANGSHTLKEFVPERTCAAIERLEAEGAVIFAKTTCPEFSLVGITDSPLYGRTANPWNLARTTGGSSGGAAAAVAAGLGTLSLASDGGGSIRIPAAFCGLVGFKPSLGLVPREPSFSSWMSLVSYGPIAKSVADARLMLDAMVTEEHRHTTTYAAGEPDALADRLRGMRVVVSEDLGFAPVDADVLETFRQTIQRLEQAGAELVFDHPGLPSSVKTWSITAFYDAWQHALEQQHDHEELGETTRAILEFGQQFSETDYQQAQDYRHEIQAAYLALFERTGADALLTPALGCEAFGHGRLWPERIGTTTIELPWVDWVGFLYDANLTGMPACAVPIGLGDEGLPVSLQVIGPVGSDSRVLEVAEGIEALVDWRHQCPNEPAPMACEQLDSVS